MMGNGTGEDDAGKVNAAKVNGFLQDILDAAGRSCDQAEVYYARHVTTPVEFANNRLKQIRASDHLQISLRVIKDGQLGVATTTKPGDVRSVVGSALLAARYGGPAGFDFMGPVPAYPAPEAYDPDVPAVPLERMVTVGGEMVAAARAVAPEAQTMVQLERSERETTILTSRGGRATGRTTRFSLIVRAKLIEGTNMLQAYDVAASTHLVRDTARLKAFIQETLTLGRENVSIKSGRYRAVLSPRGVSHLLLPLQACVNGRAVERGLSPWKDKLGAKLFDERFSVVDDGLLARGAATAAFDDEGAPRQRTAIIDRGTLAEFILDLKAASALGRQPTGNAARGHTGVPAPSLSNILILPGDTPFASLVADIKEGIWVDDLMGAWAGNLYAGEVNGNISLGYKIENGERVGRIKDCMFSANAFAVLQDKLVGISRETLSFGPFVAPYVVIDDVSLATKS